MEKMSGLNTNADETAVCSIELEDAGDDEEEEALNEIEQNLAGEHETSQT